MRLLAAIALLAVVMVATTLMPGAQAAREFTVRVHGTDNIWLAGGNPAPGSFPGTKPPGMDIPNNATAVTVIRATGLISCCGGAPDTPPDGGTSATSITPTTGSIGPYEGPSNLPLVGLFLKGQATGDAPADFNRDDDGQFRTASPRLKQPFFIGDGDTPGGATQTYRIPNGAQRLYLGIADGFSFSGPPDYYEDNKGSFRVRVRFETGGGGGGGGGLDSLPPPELGQTANVGPVRGDVLIGIRRNGARASQKGVRFVPLTEARQIPIGSFLDTSDGVVALRTARNDAGVEQPGRFAAGLFQVLQSRRQSAKGLTELRLKGSAAGFRRCDATNRAGAALSRRTVRRLRANAKGRYRTRGRHSAATVRGTRWVTEDRCDGTLTTVKRGTVVVRDFRLKESITVTAGKSYLARAPD
jgi:hypothetical protein